MSALSDRIRAAREQWVTADGQQWLLRRPTQLQLSRLAHDPVEIVLVSAVGWKLPESDLVPGGGGRVPPFDSEAFREYAADRPALITELSEHLHRMLEEFQAQKDDVSKN